jgi:hypothetical protein
MHLVHSFPKVANSSGFVFRMVARYAPPISYNFLNLIRLGGNKTTFEKVTVVMYSLFLFSMAYTYTIH